MSTQPFSIVGPGITVAPDGKGGTTITVREMALVVPGASPQRRQASVTLSPEDLAKFKAQLG